MWGEQHMSWDSLPRELQEIVVEMLPPADVKRLMLTCREGAELGRRAGVWTELRQLCGLPPPRPRATKFKTDHDVVAPHLCRLCWAHDNHNCIHGVCRWCRWEHSTLAKNICLVDVTTRQLGNARKARRVIQGAIRATEDTMDACRVLSQNWLDMGLLSLAEVCSQTDLAKHRKRMAEVEDIVGGAEFTLARCRAVMEAEAARIQRLA